MKPQKIKLPLLLILLAVLMACNFTAVSNFGAPTATATQPPPSPTLPPTEAPPTATATIPPPTATAALPVALPTAQQSPSTPIPEATARPTQAPTKAVVNPAPKARFAGKFEGGVFSFRTNDAGTYVTLKEITLNKAKCANGKTASTHLTFEDISFFEVKASAFNISFDRATVSGVFDNSNAAHGTIWIKINANKGVCEIGPVGWTASAP